jgi:hypothetical protein
MKKFSLLLILSLIFFSCEKEYLIPENEVPEWLKSQISLAEKSIKENPKGLHAYSAWIRYKWQNEYYFEHDYLSSASPLTISTTQDTLLLNPLDTSTDYYKGKCCRQYVWKGPDYKELPGM